MDFWFFGVAVLSAVGFLAIRDKYGGVLPLFLKCLTTASFLCLCLTSGLGRDLQKYFAIGLVFCLLGDTLLDLKITYPKDDKAYTFAGMGAFSIAQIAFVIGLAVSFGTAWYVYLIGAVAAAVTLLGCKFMLKLDFGKYLPVVIVYTITLCIVAVQACFVMITSHCTAQTIVLFVGSLLFLASDGVLSLTYFGRKDSKFVIFANHLLYFLAIALYATAIALL